MNKFLRSRFFVAIFTFLSFILGGIAGWLLGYQPYVSGKVNGYSSEFGGSTKGSTSTEYVFQIKTACGYWLIALAITLVVFLLSVLVRKMYLKNNSENDD